MTFEYAVIGGGPAGITAVIRIMEKLLATDSLIKTSIIAKDFVNAHKILKQKLCWIDPTFTVGAFGNEWKNVPGNTIRQRYRDTFTLMEETLKKYGVQLPSTPFDLDGGVADDPCKLVVAAQKLQWMSAQINQMVTSVKAKVEKVDLMESGLKKITPHNGGPADYSHRVILAIGDQARSVMPKEHQHKIIPLGKVADFEKLKAYIDENKLEHKKPILVHGSSHSAALAVMHFLLLGFEVHQVMNKPYAYCRTVKEGGMIKTYDSNTGLNGSVAVFTKTLFEQIAKNKGHFASKYKPMVVPNGIVKNYDHYDHIVEVIGRKPNATLMINGKCSSLLNYNPATSQTEIKGIFAVGSAYPRERADAAGKLEKNNGASRYYGDIDPNITDIWHVNPVPITTRLLFFKPSVGSSASSADKVKHSLIRSAL